MSLFKLYTWKATLIMILKEARKVISNETLHLSCMILLQNKTNLFTYRCQIGFLTCNVAKLHYVLLFFISARFFWGGAIFVLSLLSFPSLFFFLFLLPLSSTLYFLSISCEDGQMRHWSIMGVMTNFTNSFAAKIEH